MSDEVQVTNRNGKLWMPDATFYELCGMLDALEMTHYQDVLEGAVRRLGLDPQTRTREGNRTGPEDLRSDSAPDSTSDSESKKNPRRSPRRRPRGQSPSIARPARGLPWKSWSPRC